MAKISRPGIFAAFLLLAAWCACAAALKPDGIAILRTGNNDCSKYVQQSRQNNGTKKLTFNSLGQNLELWQGIVLMMAFGAFALFIAIIHRIVRTKIYYDAHLLDTFFDAGGDVNMGMIACFVVAKWTWTASFSWSTNTTVKYGLAGHFWCAAGAAIQLFLFAIVGCEIRIKAPGAKTFLQVIRARHGAITHLIVMTFALFANAVISSMVMAEGTTMLTSVTDGLTKEVATLVLAIVVGLFTVVGGIGGSIYVAYFSCAIMMSIVMVYFAEVFYNPLNHTDNKYGSANKIFDIVQCGRADKDNDDSSLMTFLSRGGMLEGIIIILSSFSSVFVDQSFWQGSIASKPAHGVAGLITGGLAWFAIPFCAAFAFGMHYWAMAIEDGQHTLPTDKLGGLLPVYVSQKMLGQTGDFIMFVFTLVCVVTTAAAQVLAVSSIIIYDIYQAYVAPFTAKPIPPDRQMSMRVQRAIRNEEYLEYDRRCVILKHVVVISISILLIPATLIILAIDIDVAWLFKFLGVMVGSCVIPIALSITWHRTTGAGVSVGCLGGFTAAVISWLVYASTYNEGLTKFRENTGRPEPFFTGTAVALGFGGLLCIMVSLSCGGCDGDLQEEEQWEKTRSIDNILLPWAIKYAPDIGATHMQKGRPHFFTVRRTFRNAEVSAYLIGVLLAVGAVLMWPACMLLLQVFNKSEFSAWTLVMLVWGIVATAYLIIVPLVWEFVQTCRQAYYNRQWSKAEHTERFTGIYDEPLSDPPPESDYAHDEKPAFDSVSNKSSDIHSTIGRDSGIDESTKKERWKTFIHLD